MEGLIGDYLGELGNEVPDGEELESVCIGGETSERGRSARNYRIPGPKQYVMRFRDAVTKEITRVDTKVRGITLDSDALKVRMLEKGGEAEGFLRF